MQNKGSFRNHNVRPLGPSVRICQLNIEGMSRAKGECLSRLLRGGQVDIALIQGTHIADEQLKTRGKVPGYSIIGATFHHTYSIATYAKSSLKDVQLITTSTRNNTYIVAISYAQLKIANIYKPPLTVWSDNILPNLPHPAVLAGDFNSHHQSWKYAHSDTNGDYLVHWADSKNFHLVFDAKDLSSFISARWGTIKPGPHLCLIRFRQSPFPHQTHSARQLSTLPTPTHPHSPWSPNPNN